MDKFLERQSAKAYSRRTKNRFIQVVYWIEFLVKTLLTKKTQGPHYFNVEFYHTFKEEKIPVLYNLSQKIEEEETLSKSNKELKEKTTDQYSS